MKFQNNAIQCTQNNSMKLQTNAVKLQYKHKKKIQW